MTAPRLINPPSSASSSLHEQNRQSACNKVTTGTGKPSEGGLLSIPAPCPALSRRERSISPKILHKAQICTLPSGYGQKSHSRGKKSSRPGR